MDLDTAVALGLRGHSKLIGHSAIGNGATKHDYLCVAKMSILGIETSLVVKVSPNQPNLLGLDAMLLYDMQISPLQKKFTMCPNPVDMSLIRLEFRWLDFGLLLQQLDITPSDLVPMGDLPPPEKTYQTLVIEGKANCVIDLGTSYLSPGWVQPKRQHIYDLGCS